MCLFGEYPGWVLLTTLVILVLVSLFNTFLLVWMKVSQKGNVQKNNLSRGERDVHSEIYEEIVDTEKSDSLHYQSMYEVKHYPVYSVPSTRKGCSGSMPTNPCRFPRSQIPTCNNDIRRAIETREATVSEATVSEATAFEDEISLNIEDEVN